MLPIKTLTALAALAGATAFAAAQPGAPGTPAGAGQACWLQAETGRNMTALSAWAASDVEGEWFLRVRGGSAYDSEQSGYVEARGEAKSFLTRLVVAQGAFRAPLQDFRAGGPVPVTPGTTVIASNYQPAEAGTLPLEAELRLYDASGALICEAREIWHRAGR